MNFWQTILIAIISSGVFGIIIQLFLKHFFDLKLRKLELEVYEKIESFKHNLSVEFMIQEKVYFERFNVIKKLYHGFISIEFKINELTAFLKPAIDDLDKNEIEQLNALIKVYNKTIELYRTNEILLSQKILDRIKQLTDITKDIILSYELKLRYGDQTEIQYSMMDKKALDIMPKVIGELRAELKKYINISN